MSAKTVIRNGTVVSPAESRTTDVLIEDGIVTALGHGLSGGVEIEAGGLLVLPGGIDVHTHMEMPVGSIRSTDDFYTGTVAAAAGGTTTIIDFVEPTAGQSLSAALDNRLATAKKGAVVDFGLHMTVNRVDAGILAELARMVELGVPTFKCYMAYAGLMLDDESLFRVLLRSTEVGGRVSVHAENGAIIRHLVERFTAEGHVEPVWHARSHPALMEAEATGRAIDLASLAGARLYVVHVSAADSLARVAAAGGAARGVYAETCPQYLVLSEDRYEKPGFEGAKYVMSPPLRTPSDMAALWEGVGSGLIQTVATDHCPFNFRGQKELGLESFARIPNGAGGVETRLMLLHHFGVNAGRISVNRFVEVTAAAPARLFGLEGRKGAIAPGRDADIVLWDPGREKRITATELHQNVDYTPYEGFVVKGCPVLTMRRGEILMREGKMLARKGSGEFLRRQPVGPAG